MNVHRLLSFSSPVILLALLAIGAVPARAAAPLDSDAPVAVSGTLLASSSPVPEPGSGLLFFVGVGAIAGALELRRRAATH